LEFNTGYSPEDKAAVPPEAESFSLGCGNPFAMANIKPGDTILDIGSGGGMDSFLAASKVGAKGNVIGVDMTPAMLQRARMSAEKSGIHNVEFRQGFAEALPLEDETVDVVISNCVVNLCEDKGRVFQEAFRVLKPGGQLELSDMVTSGPLSMDARYNSEGWSECLTGALPEAEYLNLIAQAGFNINNKKRSTSAGEVSGTSIYSMIISAIKEPKTDEAKSSCGCCC
jgi:ubiquinone/menaquinone biosynthesis C-methylase UbiE